MESPTYFKAMLKFVSTNGIKPILGVVLPLSEGNKAIQQMESSPQFAKYVLRIS
jgi:D-arabinose 1-dehydrogenase-like Zn-dependent alcohol dehydrogenase